NLDNVFRLRNKTTLVRFTKSAQHSPATTFLDANDGAVFPAISLKRRIGVLGHGARRATGLMTLLWGSPPILFTVSVPFLFACLSLVEGGQPGSLHGRNVNKHVLAAALRLNESIALGRVEPLHSSGSHRCLLANHDVRCRCRES